MAKNILVTNYNGDIIGATYPKRARGLIKSGRAMQIDEFTIKLSDAAAADAFSIQNNMEDKDMANVIEFRARGFKLDEKIGTGKGTRLMVTECGESVECFEIAQGGAATGITKVAELEKDKDYVFRFAMKSKFVRADVAESSVSIFFKEPGDGYTYPIDRGDKNRFKPVVCKKTDDGIFRVFELPFNSGDDTSCTISIQLHDMTAWIYPAKDVESYSALEDIDYDLWRQDEIHNIAKTLNNIGGSIGGTLNDIGGTLGDTLNGIGEFAVGVGDKIAKTVSDVFTKSADKEAAEESPKGDDAEIKVTEVDAAAEEVKEEVKEEAKEEKTEGGSSEE